MESSSANETNLLPLHIVAFVIAAVYVCRRGTGSKITRFLNFLECYAVLNIIVAIVDLVMIFTLNNKFISFLVDAVLLFIKPVASVSITLLKERFDRWRISRKQESSSWSSKSFPGSSYRMREFDAVDLERLRDIGRRSRFLHSRLDYDHYIVNTRTGVAHRADDPSVDTIGMGHRKEVPFATQSDIERMGFRVKQDPHASRPSSTIGPDDYYTYGDYVLNTKTKVAHRRDDPSVETIGWNHREDAYYANVAELKEKGYRVKE